MSSVPQELGSTLTRSVAEQPRVWFVKYAANTDKYLEARRKLLTSKMLLVKLQGFF